MKIKKILLIMLMLFSFSGCIVPQPSKEGFIKSMNRFVGKELKLNYGFIGKKEYDDEQYVYEFKVFYASSSRTTLKENKKLYINKNIIVGFITDKNSSTVKYTITKPKIIPKGTLMHSAGRYEYFGLQSETNELNNIYYTKVIPKKYINSKVVYSKNNDVILSFRFDIESFNNKQDIYKYKNSEGCEFGYIINKNDPNKIVKSWIIINEKEKCIDYKDCIDRRFCP